MDRLESLGNQLSQLTMYDLKAAYNQVGRAQSATLSTCLVLLIMVLWTFSRTMNDGTLYDCDQIRTLPWG